MKASVVVATYNRLEKLKICLDALLKQNFRDDYEVVIVDDGSSDKTREYLTSKALEHGILKVFFQANQGPAKARNTGINLSQGEYVFFTDDDVVVPSNWISIFSEYLDSNHKIAAVGGYIGTEKNIEKNNVIAQYESYFVNEVYQRPDREYVGGFETHGVVTCNSAYRKSVLTEVKGFDEKFPVAAGEDADMKLRVVRNGHVLAYLPVRAVHIQDYTLKRFIQQQTSRGQGTVYFNYKWRESLDITQENKKYNNSRDWSIPLKMIKEKKMRIFMLFCLSHLCNRYGRYLSKKRNVSVLAIYGVPQKYATSIRIRNLLRKVLGVNIREIHTPIWPDITFIKYVMVVINIIKVLNPLLKPKYLYATPGLIASAIPAIVAHSVRRIPIIADWDDSFADITEGKFYIWQSVFWEYQVVKKAKKVVVVSNRLREIAVSLGHGQENIEYIPNGVDTIAFNPSLYQISRPQFRKKIGVNNQETLIGFCGSLMKYGKDRFVGQEIVDCAVELIYNRKCENIKFIIVGFGNGYNSLKKYISKKRLSDKFILTGHVPHNKIPEIINSFDVCVMSMDIHSFTALTRSSCKLKEFMAMDKIIVTPGIGENLIDLNDGEFGILVQSDKELGLGLVKYLSDTDRYKSIHPRERAKIYEYRKLSEKLGKFIKD